MACPSAATPQLRDAVSATRGADSRTRKQTMRLRKTEWMGVAVVAGSIACFGSWLQGELSRAAQARVQRDTLDAHSYCSGMSVQDTQRMDKGELWCGTIDAMHADSLAPLIRQ